jgi:hypothetical protein
MIPRTIPFTRALLLVLLLCVGQQAQALGPREAIEKLEGCSASERGDGCVKILKKKAATGDIQEVKAQIRGGRIIWYQYDRKTGRVKRLN